MRGHVDWPLAGREGELDELLRCVRDSRGALVSGPAGVGKTRLAREVLARAAGPDTPARWAVASTSARTVPFGAFTAITSALAPAAEDAALLARVAAALRVTDTALGVDDAHLLDPASAALVYELATEHAVRMVVTVRDGEDAPEPVAALERDGLLPRVALAPLDRDQTAAMLAAGLGGPVDGITVDRLHEVTAGNALWLRMLVDGERAAGRIVRSPGGTWMWTGGLRLSPALDGLVAAGIEELDDAPREALELLALGEPLPPDVLAGLVDPAAVETLLAQGLARLDADRLRVAHPLFGEAVRARVSLLRARRLRGALYDALTAAPDGRRDGSADTLRRAALLLDSDRPRQPDLLLAAAVSALAFADAEAAVRLAGAARDAGGGFEAQIMYAFLRSWAWSGDPETEHEFGAAVELARNDDERVRAGLGYGFGLMFHGRYAAYRERREDLVARLGDPARAIELDCVDALAAAFADDLSRAAALVAPVLTGAGRGSAARAYAGWTAAALAALQGWDEASTAAVRRTYAECVRQPETTPLVLNIAFWEVLGLALTGRLAAAEAALAPFREIPPAMRFLTDAFAAVGDIAAGRVTTAASRLHDALLRAPGEFGGWTTMWAALGCRAAAAAGDVAAAAESWRTCRAYRTDAPKIDDAFCELAQAWLTAAEGAVSVALDRARGAAATAATARQWAVELAARLDAVRFGDPGQAERLATLARVITGPLPSAAAAHARALADRDASGLLAAAGAYEAAGLLLPAADATAQAAVLLPAGPDRAAATAAAAALAGRCEGARTPALVAALHPLPISPREREIATLARHGLTNRQIGERLHLSTRTVEGHVYHACTKLGVTSRHDLAQRVAG